MNIKKQLPKLILALLSFSMVFGNVIPAYAAEVFISENILEEALNENDEENLMTLENKIEVQADSESRYEEIEVNYSQSSSYFVTIPKTITLGPDKKASYSIKVEGDIVANKQVCVVPVDGIADTEVFDFYMKDQIAGSTKEDVVAEVSQTKFYWNYEEAKAGYVENDNYVIANDLSAGSWKGIFQMEISMRTDPSHIHNYVGEVTKEPTCAEAGEKTYTCDCGDSYTETLPPIEHNYINGECEHCGEKDPNYHKHSYTSDITKEPTCTEAGEKTYTCDCGDSYTEVIPATGHNYEEGSCTKCGEADPDAIEIAPEGELSKWKYTLDNVNNVVTLNYYVGFDEHATVYAAYALNGKTYKTQIDNNNEKYYNTKKYMFPNSAKTLKTITFKPGIDTSNLTSINFMFYNCYNLTSIEGLENLDTSNVTDMRGLFTQCFAITSGEQLGLSNLNTSNVRDMNQMFDSCTSLKSLDLSNFDTSNVTDMSYMFRSCTNLEDINLSNFNTGNVTDMKYMFGYCRALCELDLCAFDISNVTDMTYMFYNCSNLKTIYATDGQWTSTNMFTNCGTSSVTYK